MEEQRISMMYLNLVRARLSRMWFNMFGRGPRRSSLLPVVVVLIIATPVLIYYLHIHARFHEIKKEIKGPQPEAAAMGPRPGGSDPVVLTRQQTPGNNLPEFLTVTVLPGLGMDILQITASLPGLGETSLLAAPTVQQMADGAESRDSGPDLHGALEAPWAGTLNGVLSPLANSLTASWKGHTIEVPTNTPGGQAMAEGGLLMREQLEVSRSPQLNGDSVSGTVHGTNFGGKWPSTTDLTAAVQLSAGVIDVTLTARNTGPEAEPMGLGWAPHFAIPSHTRAGAELRLPAGQVLDIGDRHRMPSGRTIANPAVERFEGHAAALGEAALDADLVHLKAGLMDMGPQVELRDPDGRFGLRLTAMSPSIRQLHVSSPAAARYVLLGLQTNLDDPLGREWSNEEAGGITTLQPGQSTEFKVRLEIFPLMLHSASP